MGHLMLQRLICACSHGGTSASPPVTQRAPVRGQKGRPVGSCRRRAWAVSLVTPPCWQVGGVAGLTRRAEVCSSSWAQQCGAPDVVDDGPRISVPGFLDAPAGGG